jgi:fructose-1,6-bisphosphatase
MLSPGYTTISKFLIEQVSEADHGRELAALLVDVAAVIKGISAALGKGALIGLPRLGELEQPAASGTAARLQKLADDYFTRGVEWSGLIGALASEGMDSVHFVEGRRGPLALIFDSLEGAPHLDVNVSVGSIFSVLALPESPGGDSAVLQPGSCQLAAGYAIYGPSTQLVITVGQGTHGFTLDREVGNFVLTNPDVRIAGVTSEYFINTSNLRFWEPPIARFVDECRAGREGPRGRDFNMRWAASMISDVHRILMRGGIYLFPRDQREDHRSGRLKLLFEANPMAMLVEQAGGTASTGRGRILDQVPESLHQRIPVIMGTPEEVERVRCYHEEYDSGEDQPYSSPLFGERSLFTNH